MATQYACDPVPPYKNVLCSSNELARVRSIALVKATSVVSDPTSDAVWAALEASGDAVIMREIRGLYDGGAVVEAPGFGSQLVKIQNMNHTLTLTDPKTIDNIAFYNAMKRNSYQYRLWFLTETQVWETFGVPTFAPTMPVPEDISQEVYIVTAIKWQYEDLPTPYDKPTSYLDTIAA